MQKIHSEVKKNLEQANAKYKKAADQHKRAKVFEVCVLVMAHLRGNRFPAGTYIKLKNKKGPFRIFRNINVYLQCCWFV